MTLAGLLQWWNLIFVLPILLSVLLLLASAAGGLGEGGGDAETDTDVEADADTDADGHAGAPDGSGVFAGAIKFAGVGAVPVSLLAQGFLLFFGVFGLAANLLLNTEANPDRRVWLALVAALAAGAFGMAAVGALGRRFLPRAVPAVGNKDLVGRTGRVVFAVTEGEGLVQVRDAVGTLHQVAARVTEGEAPLAAGQEVLVTGYDRERGAFLVDESPFAVSPDALRRGEGLV